MRRKKLVLIAAVLAVLIAALACVLRFAAPKTASSVSATRSAELGLILLDEDDGLFVLAITEGSPAGKAGFLAGDLLLQANDVVLTTAVQLEDLIAQSSEPLPILLNRDGEEMTLNLPTRADLAKKKNLQYTNLSNGGDLP